MNPPKIFTALCLIPLVLAAGCGRNARNAPAPGGHEHHPPHGGTPVVLGNELYHIELVRDASAGTLSAYLLDGEMEDFVRSPMPSFEIDAEAGGRHHVLVLSAVANPATGETVGDTSLFEARADWLGTEGTFVCVIRSVTLRGTAFENVKFNFPEGNDTD